MELEWGSIDSAFDLIQFYLVCNDSSTTKFYQAADFMVLALFTFLYLPKSRCGHRYPFQCSLFE